MMSRRDVDWSAETADQDSMNYDEILCSKLLKAANTGGKMVKKKKSLLTVPETKSFEDQRLVYTSINQWTLHSLAEEARNHIYRNNHDNYYTAIVSQQINALCYTVYVVNLRRHALCKSFSTIGFLHEGQIVMVRVNYSRDVESEILMVLEGQHYSQNTSNDIIDQPNMAWWNELSSTLQEIKFDDMKSTIFRSYSVQIQSVLTNQRHRDLLSVSSEQIARKSPKIQLKRAQIGLQILECELKQTNLLYRTRLFTGICYCSFPLIIELYKVLCLDEKAKECVSVDLSEASESDTEIEGTRVHVTQTTDVGGMSVSAEQLSDISTTGSEDKSSEHVVGVDNVNNERTAATTQSSPNTADNKTSMTSITSTNSTTTTAIESAPSMVRLEHFNTLLYQGYKHDQDIGTLRGRLHLIAYCNKFLDSYTTMLSMNDGECPVCFESFSDVQLAVLKCKHVLCATCWKTMNRKSESTYGRKAKCPLCRA